MKIFYKSILVALLLAFISCNPDEELDNNGNSGNNGNNGNNGGGNTINPISYPEIVNLLEGNWYGDSIQGYALGGDNNWQEFAGPGYGHSSTLNTGYISFSSNSTGSVDFSIPTEYQMPQPPYEDLTVSKYPCSVTITDGSWSGSGAKFLYGDWQSVLYARENNWNVDKSYSIVRYTTPCYNVTTPTIQYAIRTNGFNWNSDIILGNLSSEDWVVRIHTLSATTLKLLEPWGNGSYKILTFKR